MFQDNRADMNHKVTKVAMGLMLLLVLLVSCGEKPPLRLTTIQRDQVDTLYLRAINQGGVAAEMDSLCQAKREIEIKILVDSMLQVRRAEEQALRDKYSN